MQKKTNDRAHKIKLITLLVMLFPIGIIEFYFLVTQRWYIPLATIIIGAMFGSSINNFMNKRIESEILKSFENYYKHNVNSLISKSEYDIKQEYAKDILGLSNLSLAALNLNFECNIEELKNKYS